jgi:hypothetical protein
MRISGRDKPAAAYPGLCSQYGRQHNYLVDIVLFTERNSELMSVPHALLDVIFPTWLNAFVWPLQKFNVMFEFLPCGSDTIQ